MVQQLKTRAKELLLKKIDDRSASIGIIGLGYVGLPLALCFTEAGYGKVIGFDIDASKVGKVNSAKSYIKHIDSNRIDAAINSGFHATTDFSKVGELDAIIMCVPTPLNKYREPDLSYVINTVEAILPYLAAGQVISLESTTYPGTTEEELLPRIESRGLVVGEDCYLLFSPEREDPGNPFFNTKTIAKVVGGHTPACLEVGIKLYASVMDKVVPVSSTKAAELTKLLENIHRAVNIGLVNEMKVVADKMNIDIYEVIDAAATKPFGFTPYYPGPGLGGHCIPIDPFYLTWKAREYGLHTRFIELAGEINGQMIEWVISKISYGLNLAQKSLNGSKILMVGLAYKKNIDDSRESPSIEIFELLVEHGAHVDYIDPYVPVFPLHRKCYFDKQSIELTAEAVNSYDCVVIATDHDSIDYDLIADKAKMIVDCRGRYRNRNDNIIRG